MANLSDFELRNLLIARGFNPPPVTDTSRALLVKKLKKLEASQATAAVNNVSVNNVDQHDGRASRRTRLSERNQDSSPEILANSYPSVPDISPSPPRLTRSARKEAIVDKTDSMAHKIKTSIPYLDANYVKGGGGSNSGGGGGGGGGGSVSVGAVSGGDPFEKGSDSDDSLYSSRANSRYLVRKPIGMRRESEYFTAPATYRKYDALNGASSFPSKGVSRSRYSRVSSGGKQFISNLSWKVVTPTMVLASCLVFFVVVAGIYYTKNDRSYNELAVADILEQPKCGSRSRKGVPCVPDKEIPSAIDYLKLLYRALYKRKLNVICYGSATSKPGHGRMSHDEIVELLTMEAGLLHFECQAAIENMKALVAANPQLKITSSAAAGFELEDPILPWSCTLRIWSGWLWEYVVYVILTVTLVCSMHFLFRWAINRYQQQAQEKQELIKGVLEILQQNAVANPSQGYLPIVHVRDQLITFADRNRKRKMWLEVVKYVEENESRVRKEVQPFEGEDYDVWRWVGGHQLSAPKPKTWQGEAFETSKDTMNTPSTSPTPCLKIRHMFDPKNEAADEDWSTAVKDAILERCEGVHIVHIVVDESSPEGCVYIKCASTDDAGKAYRKIHGAWFDGKIVTVKYLRLERYHERFPASMGLTKQLFPSNDQKRSLAS